MEKTPLKLSQFQDFMIEGENEKERERGEREIIFKKKTRLCLSVYSQYLPKT